MNTPTLEVSGAVGTGLLVFGASMIDVSDPVIVAAGGTILAALTGAVKVLWDRNNKLSQTTDIALSKCEEEHKRSAIRYDENQRQSAERMNVLIEKVISLSGEVGLMKGRIQGFQEATDKAETIARERAAHDEHTTHTD
jgi:ribonuclease PH